MLTLSINQPNLSKQELFALFEQTLQIQIQPNFDALYDILAAYPKKIHICLEYTFMQRLQPHQYLIVVILHQASVHNPNLTLEFLYD